MVFATATVPMDSFALQYAQELAFQMFLNRPAHLQIPVLQALIAVPKMEFAIARTAHQGSTVLPSAWAPVCLMLQYPVVTLPTSRLHSNQSSAVPMAAG
jgi:hypothetical protein